MDKIVTELHFQVKIKFCIEKKELKRFHSSMKENVSASIFSHLIGNPIAKDILERLLEKGTLPSVLLFHGIEGIGKGLFAKAVAEKLMGRIKKDHPDIHIYYPEGKSSQHPISAMRQLIDEVGMPPFEAPCKVFIVHDAEKMLPSSSNALLKTLEEPPTDTYIFLISSDPDKLLPTIVSRCRKIPFFPVPEEELAAFLNTPEGKRMAYLAQGSVAKALKETHYSVDDLFHCKTYGELLQAFSKLEDGSDDEEGERLTKADEIFEAILYWVREHKPLQLERAFRAIQECRTAVFHHVKLKHALERLFLSLSH
jgi:DNA polymerase-3 subunit delta'